MLVRPNITGRHKFLYRQEFNSPSVPPVTLPGQIGSTPLPVHEYQLKVVCPICSQEGYSAWNIIKLDIMLSFPLCWTEVCPYCESIFSASNGIVGVCAPCRHQLDCLERGMTVVELMQIPEKGPLKGF